MSDNGVEGGCGRGPDAERMCGDGLKEVERIGQEDGHDKGRQFVWDEQPIN